MKNIFIIITFEESFVSPFRNKTAHLVGILYTWESDFHCEQKTTHPKLAYIKYTCKHVFALNFHTFSEQPKIGTKSLMRILLADIESWTSRFMGNEIDL